jgi:hypothetical protein
MAFIVKQRSGKENFTIVPPESSKMLEVQLVAHLLVLHRAGATSITLGGSVVLAH